MPAVKLRKPKQLVLPIIEPVQMPAPARKALEYLEKMENNTFYFGFGYGYVKPDGEIWRNRNRSCHAEMNHYNVAKSLFTIMPVAAKNDDPQYTKEIRLRWSEYLTKYSPWKDVPTPNSVEFGAEKGWVIHNLKLPSNLIAGFCFATRTPCEHLAETLSMFDYMDKGVDPNLAMFFGTALLHADDKAAAWDTVNRGHHPVDTGTAYKEYVENFCLGRPAKPNKPFQDSPNYSPVNAIWGGSAGWGENAGDKMYHAYLKQEYKPKDAGVGVRAFNVGRQIMKHPKEWWLEVALAETKRIGELRNANKIVGQPVKADGVGELGGKRRGVRLDGLLRDKAGRFHKRG